MCQYQLNQLIFPLTKKILKENIKIIAQNNKSAEIFDQFYLNIYS